MKNYFAILALAASIACQDGGPTASSSFGPGGLPAISVAEPIEEPTVTPVNPGTEVPDGVATPSDIELVGLNRQGIRVKAECSGVTFFVPATGADYVNVWIPELHGLKYGPNPVNEEFVLHFTPGTYRFQLAVEKKTGDPNHPIAQDDRHRGEFTVECDTPPPPPVDMCPNFAGIQETVPEGLVLNEAGECVEPEPECEQVWVVDKEAYTEVVTIVDQEAYEEDVTTCVPQEPLPGDLIVTGFVYKLTGANDQGLREAACEGSGVFSLYTPKGSYELSQCIPGNGAVDACVFTTQNGVDDERKFFSKKVKFEYVPECNITIPGEPIPQPDKCTVETILHPAVTHEETIEHEEVGHFEQVCNER